MSTIKFEAFAYLPDYLSLEDITEGRHIPALSPEENDSWHEKQGYPMVGKVSFTLTLNSPDKIVQGQIEALNKKLQAERAESQQRQNAILNQISKLQALTFAGTTGEQS